MLLQNAVKLTRGDLLRISNEGEVFSGIFLQLDKKRTSALFMREKTPADERKSVEKIPLVKIIAAAKAHWVPIVDLLKCPLCGETYTQDPLTEHLVRRHYLENDAAIIKTVEAIQVRRGELITLMSGVEPVKDKPRYPAPDELPFVELPGPEDEPNKTD